MDDPKTGIPGRAPEVNEFGDNFDAGDQGGNFGPVVTEPLEVEVM